MFDQIFDDIESSLKESKMVQNVALILDRSGSMSGMKNVVKEIVDEQLNELLELSSKTNIHTYVTIALFSGHKDDFIVETFDLINEKAIKRCNRYVEENYHCGGMTALFDSMYKVISHIEGKIDEDKETENLIITVSDGAENDSIEIKRDAIKRIVEEKEESESPKWKFVYLGTMESLESATDININHLNTMSFASEEDLKRNFRYVTQSNQVYYASRVNSEDTRNIYYNDDTVKRGSLDEQFGLEKKGE